MPTMERVKIEDVFPWVDEYGNEFLSRDYSTKENKEYMERLKRSMRAKGVPDEPVTLSRDGGIYRIVAGNSRVRAMRELGTKSFDAVVLDDEEAQDAVRRAVEATVRTNTKKEYAADELGSYVRQLTLLGDDEYVSEVSGVDAERVAKVRRAGRAVGDATMSIERMCAIAEFEGDEQAVRELTECSEREVTWKANQLRERREREAARAEIAEALEGAGIVILETAPEGRIYCATVSDPEGVPDTGGPLDPTFAVATTWGAGYSLYRMPTGADREQEERLAAKREERELAKLRDRKRAKEGRERRSEWLRERLANFDPRRIPHLCELAANYAAERADEVAVRMLNDAHARPTAGNLDVAEAYQHFEVGEYGIAQYGYGDEGERRVHAYRAELFGDLMEAMVADGYEMDQAEAEMYDEALNALKEA